MKIAAAQISCALGDRAANLRKVRDFSSLAKKAGADLIVFPEMIDTGYSMPTIQKHATAWKEGAVPELQEIAKALSIAIISGISDRDGGRIYNSQVLVDANGEVIANIARPTWLRVIRSTSADASPPAIPLRFGRSTTSMSASAFVTIFAFRNFIARSLSNTVQAY